VSKRGIARRVDELIGGNTSDQLQLSHNLRRGLSVSRYLIRDGLCESASLEPYR
jgi:hypothetical protein